MEFISSKKLLLLNRVRGKEGRDRRALIGCRSETPLESKEVPATDISEIESTVTEDFPVILS